MVSWLSNLVNVSSKMMTVLFYVLRTKRYSFIQSISKAKKESYRVYSASEPTLHFLSKKKNLSNLAAMQLLV